MNTYQCGQICLLKARMQLLIPECTNILDRFTELTPLYPSHVFLCPRHAHFRPPVWPLNRQLERPGSHDLIRKKFSHECLLRCRVSALVFVQGKLPTAAYKFTNFSEAPKHTEKRCSNLLVVPGWMPLYIYHVSPCWCPCNGRDTTSLCNKWHHPVRMWGLWYTGYMQILGLLLVVFLETLRNLSLEQTGKSKADLKRWNRMLACRNLPLTSVKRVICQSFHYVLIFSTVVIE